jgi:23S rRNA pseudouridine1911/1915/1917 synthase
VRWVAPEPGLLLEALHTLVPGASRRTLRQMLAQGRVSLNGHPVRRADQRIEAGDRVEVGARIRARPEIDGLDIVYEDDALVVVEKPSGLLTVATPHEQEETAHARLRAYARERDPRAQVFVVHRLDRFASGLLVFACTPEVKERLQALFQAHAVERRYWAVVEGTIAEDRGTIRSRLVEGRDLRMRSTVEPGQGKAAVTHFRVLRRLPDVTALEVRLETGRKNQIRVHLAERGHPIVGDRTYGAALDPLGRLALHAFALGFAHPVTGAPLRFRSAPPPGFERYLPGRRAETLEGGPRGARSKEPESEP